MKLFAIVFTVLIALFEVSQAQYEGMILPVPSDRVPNDYRNIRQDVIDTGFGRTDTRNTPHQGDRTQSDYTNIRQDTIDTGFGYTGYGNGGGEIDSGFGFPGNGNGGQIDTAFGRGR